jgi:aspartate racemase
MEASMKIIGMIGGMSWESSLEYYRIVNEAVKERLGGFHSAKCIMYSVDFEEIERFQHQGDWDAATEVMVDAARRVERGGADLLLICTNTMHMMAEAVQGSVDIPLLHIVDVTAEAIRSLGQKTVGLLGTRFTMEQDFYSGRLRDRHGISVLIPEEDERKVIHGILYDELCLGEIRSASRDAFREIIGGLAARGAEGVILGCTEIPLIVNQEEYELPLFDTTALHALAAVSLALD